MKALTLTQPWATLVAAGHKRVETRSWTTPYRGPLAIHAAKGFPKWAREECWVNEHIRRALIAIFGPQGGAGTAAFAEYLERGVVVATCELVQVVSTQRAQRDLGLSAREFAMGDFTPGRYAWLLDNVRPLDTPVPATGALGLWEWGDAA